MRRLTGLVLAVAAFGAAGCKNNHREPAGAGSGSALLVAAPPADAAIAAGPWQVPAGARATEANADARALGAALTAHLVERVQRGEADGARQVKLVLVLEGAGGAIGADVTDEGVAQDAAPAIRAIAGEADVVLAPLVPPRPFVASDATPALELAAPLLFLAHFASSGEKRDVAVAHDHDTIAVWTMIAASDAVDVAPAWELTGTIKLAAGAKVTAPAVVAPATTPAAAAPPATGAALAATALDDALGAKGIAGDSVVKRADKPRSQWAAVKGTLDPATAAVTAYTIWRVTPAGTSTLDLVPPASAAGSWFDEVSAIDVLDVDHDGVDDAVITATWSRQLTGKSKRGPLTTTEHVAAVYVIGGARLAIGAQHAARYTTETNLGDGEDPQPDESIAFTYAIVPGPPPVLHAAVGATTISRSRVKGLLDPASDAWLTAADLAIAFH